jgi:nicotinate-nucleotide adenylyltransferase
MRVGILGGTFDPIHLGHLLLAEQAVEEGKLDQVWFIPAAAPPHKPHHTITAAHHRVEMISLAIQDQPRFALSRIELERQGPSYTFHTVTQLVEKHDNCQFFLLIGADMVKDLRNWYKMKEMLQFVQVIGLERPGVDAKGIAAEIATQVIWISQGIKTNISATMIRHRITQGKSVRYLIPTLVHQYLKEHRLYGS